MIDTNGKPMANEGPYVVRAQVIAPRTWGARTTLATSDVTSSIEVVKFPWPCTIVGMKSFAIPASDDDFTDGKYLAIDAFECALEFDRDERVGGQVASGTESQFSNLAAWDITTSRLVHFECRSMQPQVAIFYRSIRTLAGDVILGTDFLVRRLGRDMP
jgi:hypothetical protein